AVPRSEPSRPLQRRCPCGRESRVVSLWRWSSRLDRSVRTKFISAGALIATAGVLLAAPNAARELPCRLRTFISPVAMPHIPQEQNRPAHASGTFTIGGDLPVYRMGFGAMRITGRGVWGPPSDPGECVRVLQRSLEL